MVMRRANQLLKEQVMSPKKRFEAISVIASEDLPAQTASPVLGVSESGFYDWRKRRLWSLHQRTFRTRAEARLTICNWIEA